MDQPPVVDYRRPEPDPPPEWGGSFLMGLVIGVAVSALVWVPAFSINRGNSAWVYMTILIPVKIIAAITCACVPQFRRFGIGLLVSVPFGFAIFFLSCAANFSMH